MVRTATNTSKARRIPLPPRKEPGAGDGRRPPALIRRWGVVTLAALLAAAPVLAEPPFGDPTSPVASISPEEELWQSITVLTERAPTTQPSDDWFSVAERQRVALRDRVQLYLTVYPGGAHRDAAIRIELATLFEIGTLRGGALEPLCKRAAQILAAPPSEAAEHEAAWWRIVCERRGLPAATTRPASQPPRRDATDPALLNAYRDYVRNYPRSRHVPRLATLLFEDAQRRGDRAAAQAAVRHLGTHFPDHAATRALLAEWNREEAVGQPFRVMFRTADGELIDTRQYAGQPLLIVVWAGFDRTARKCVARIEKHRRAHPDVRVVGVNLDETGDQMAAACQDLGISWPQWYDGLGWGAEFARTWGVRRIPWVFVVDREGRLLGSGSDDSWEAWVGGTPPVSRPERRVPGSKPSGPN